MKTVPAYIGFNFQLHQHHQQQQQQQQQPSEYQYQQPHQLHHLFSPVDYTLDDCVEMDDTSTGQGDNGEGITRNEDAYRKLSSIDTSSI